MFNCPYQHFEKFKQQIKYKFAHKIKLVNTNVIVIDTLQNFLKLIAAPAKKT